MKLKIFFFLQKNFQNGRLKKNWVFQPPLEIFLAWFPSKFLICLYFCTSVFETLFKCAQFYLEFPRFIFFQYYLTENLDIHYFCAALSKSVVKSVGKMVPNIECLKFVQIFEKFITYGNVMEPKLFFVKKSKIAIYLGICTDI